MLKQGKVKKLSKVTAKPKVMDNLKSHRKSWNLKNSKEYEPCF